MIALRGRVADVRRSDDGGSALAIALVFLMIFGVYVGVVLQFATTGQRTTSTIRDEATNTYAGGGAIEGAINRLSQSANVNEGLTGSPCSTFTLPAFQLDNATDVDVSCAALPGSGTATTASSASTTATATSAFSVTTGPAAWNSPTAATSAGGGSATTPSFSGNGTESTTLRIGPFTPATAVPASATGISVQAILTGSTTRGTLSAVLQTPGGTPASSAAVTFASCGSPCTYSNTPSPAITSAGGMPLTSATVTGSSMDLIYQKTMNGNGSGSIDVVTLLISYTIPSSPAARQVRLVAKDGTGTLATAQVWFMDSANNALNGTVAVVKEWSVS